MMPIPRSRRIACGLIAVLLTAIPALADNPPALDLAKTIKLPGPAGKRLEHMALDGKRDRLFVANAANNSLDIIDLKTGKVLKSVPDQSEIQGVVFVPESDRVFAALGTGACHIFDGDGKLLKTHKIPRADNPYYDSKNGLVYVNGDDKKVAVIDARTMNLKTEFTLPSAPASLVVEKGRPRMYVNAHVPRQVHVLDTTKHDVLKKYQLEEAGNYPLALDEPNKRLFVGCRMEPRLVVLDTESGKQLASVPIPHDVDDVSFDAKRKQVIASCGEGFIVVVRETATNKFEVREKLPTAKMARCSLYDPETSRLFLSAPGPEVRVYILK
jgi:DNA-binding beta-propeller fold protein YncE